VTLQGLTLFAVLVYAVAYLGGWLAEGRRWPWQRGTCTLLGVGLLLAALSPPMMEYGHASLHGHMLQHLLLGMYAPIPLVLGAPVTLALRQLPRSGARRLVRFFASAPVRFITHPAVAALLDIGGMFLLYLTPLFAWSHHSASGGAMLHLHFMISGCLFAWAIVGLDRAPHPPGPRLRLGVLFVAMALHGALSKYMYLHGYPLGAETTLAAKQAAAQLMYYGGDGAAALMAVAFFARRYRRRRPSRARRYRLPAADAATPRP
jgi:putative membrane protein